MSTVVSIKGDWKRHRDAEIWCMDTLGIDCKNLMFGKWYCQISTLKRDYSLQYVTQRSYIFKHDADAVMFKLRWA